MVAATVASYLSWHYSPRNTSTASPIQLRLWIAVRARVRSVKLARITIEGISNDTTNHAGCSSSSSCACRPSSSSSVRICALKSAGMGWIRLCDKPLFSKRSRLRSGAELDRGPLLVWYCMPGHCADRPRPLPGRPAAMRKGAHGGKV